MIPEYIFDSDPTTRDIRYIHLDYGLDLPENVMQAFIDACRSHFYNCPIMSGASVVNNETFDAYPNTDSWTWGY